MSPANDPFPVTVASSRIRQLCTCVVAGRRFAVDVLEVREINVDVDVTPVTHAPRGVRGLVNVRGQIFLILDLREILGRGATPSDVPLKVILFKEIVGPTFGILVDEIGDIVPFPAEEVVNHRTGEPSLAGASGENYTAVPDDLIAGICKLPDDLVVLLDVPRLLTAVKTTKPEPR